MRSEQLSISTPSIVWIDFEPWTMLPLVRAEDAFPLHSDNGGFTFSGTLWTALYGTTGFPLLHAFPRDKFEAMTNAGMFEQNNVSAVIATFEQETVLLENPSAESVLPEWFRNQFFHVRGFSAQHCILNTAPRRAEKIVSMQKEYVAEFSALQVIPEW